MNFLIFCLCICVFWIRSQCSNVTQPDVVTSQIQFLINEEKGLRQKLQTRVSKLRNEAAALNTTIGKCYLSTHRMYGFSIIVQQRGVFVAQKPCLVLVSLVPGPQEWYR